MSLRDHHADHSEPREFWLALWVVPALLAMVAFSYWINVF